jgi:hypothetical protein
VIGKVFYTMILVVFPVIGLQRHAIITHGIGTMLAEVGISTSGDLSIFCSPVLINGLFFDLLPRAACRRGRAS